MNTSKKFARAFVSQNSGHNFAELQTLCDEIVFLSSGYELEDRLFTVITTNLLSFSPTRDIIVPVGNVYANVLVGIVAAELSREWGSFYVALYRDKEYHIQLVDLQSLGEVLDASKRTS